VPFDLFQFQPQGDFFEQRREYRQAALVALRKREGLPSPADAEGNALETRFDDAGSAYYVSPDGTRVERVLWAGAGKDGKPGAFAVGARKGEHHTAADAHWGDPNAPFEILEVSEDGRKLTDELRDLDRDATGMEIAERVSHGMAGEQAPGFELDGTSDAEVDARLQEFLKRGPR